MDKIQELHAVLVGDRNSDDLIRGHAFVSEVIAGKAMEWAAAQGWVYDMTSGMWISDNMQQIKSTSELIQLFKDQL